jgi:alanine racemase
MPASQESAVHNLDGHRPTWAAIDLNALAANFHQVQKHVGPTVKIMAVVKANAYGHGAVACARGLANEGADWFGVALPEEGIELRAAGITQPILCLGGFWAGQAAACIKHRLTPVVYRADMIAALDRAAGEARVVADIHFKIDTGMGRLGVRFDEVAQWRDTFKQFKNLRLDGLLTHFAAADDPGCEPLTADQVTRFASVVRFFRELGYDPRYLHSANSAGIKRGETWCGPAACSMASGAMYFRAELRRNLRQ